MGTPVFCLAVRADNLPLKACADGLYIGTHRKTTTGKHTWHPGFVPLNITFLAGDHQGGLYVQDPLSSAARHRLALGHANQKY